MNSVPMRLLTPYGLKLYSTKTQFGRQVQIYGSFRPQPFKKWQPCKHPEINAPEPLSLFCTVCRVKGQKLIIKDRRGIATDATIFNDDGTIGQGSFSRIESVMVKIHGKPTIRLAMKVTNKNDGDLSVVEANLMLRMNHPNIIRLVYFHEGTKAITFLMEMMEEGNLFHLIHQKWNCDEGLGIYCELFAFQMFRGLAYMHSKKIMHRDIKPDNVVVSRTTGMAKIIDFNCSTMIDPNKYHSPHVGTLPYNAPELLLGTKSYNEKVDVWSAAVTLTAMIVKKPVFLRGVKKPLDPLFHIFEFLGSPSDSDFTKMHIPMREQKECQKPKTHKDLGQALCHAPGINDKELLLDFLYRIFTYDVKNRSTALAACKHKLFDCIKSCSSHLDNGKALPDVFSLSSIEDSVQSQ